MFDHQSISATEHSFRHQKGDPFGAGRGRVEIKITPLAWEWSVPGGNPSYGVIKKAENTRGTLRPETDIRLVAREAWGRSGANHSPLKTEVDAFAEQKGIALDIVSDDGETLVVCPGNADLQHELMAFIGRKEVIEKYGTRNVDYWSEIP